MPEKLAQTNTERGWGRGRKPIPGTSPPIKRPNIHDKRALGEIHCRGGSKIAAIPSLAKPYLSLFCLYRGRANRSRGIRIYCLFALLKTAKPLCDFADTRIGRGNGNNDCNSSDLEQVTRSQLQFKRDPVFLRFRLMGSREENILLSA